MRESRILGIGLVTVVVLAACGGGAAATQGPGAATQGPGTGTTNPGGAGPTTDPGGGGGLGSGTGKVNYEVSGPIQDSGELPFFSFGSRFGGDAGVALNFTSESGNGLLGVVQVAGTNGITLITQTHSISWGQCSTFDISITGNNATGRFECQNGVGTSVTDGTLTQGVNIKGSFEAHA